MKLKETPSDLLNHISSYLPLEEQTNLFSTCKSFQENIHVLPKRMLRKAKAHQEHLYQWQVTVYLYSLQTFHGLETIDKDWATIDMVNIKTQTHKYDKILGKYERIMNAWRKNDNFRKYVKDLDTCLLKCNEITVSVCQYMVDQILLSGVQI